MTQNLQPLPPDTLLYQDTYTSSSGVRVAYEREWSKSHNLEDDGLCPLLYQYLHKSSKGRENALTSVYLPDTVIFDHNFPRAWYGFDSDNHEIVKRPGRMLDAQTMYDVFSYEAKGCDVVAQFIYVSVNAEEEWKDVLTKRERRNRTCEGQKLTYVEFFTKDMLHAFLFRQQRKPDGVLQKFVVPKGEGSSRHNFQFQVIWSPLMTTVYRRTNRHRLDDQSVSLPARASTYDGPPFFSEETLVTDETKHQLRRLCADIADHFFKTEKKRISRLSLFFRADDENRMWLLWCSSVRVGADSLNPSSLRVPVMLHMRTEVLNEGMYRLAQYRQRRDDMKRLLLLDNELFRVTHDLEFALTVNASNKQQSKELEVGGMRAPPTAGSDPWNNPSHPLYPSFRCVFATEEEAQSCSRAQSQHSTVAQSHASSHSLSRSPDNAVGGGEVSDEALVRRELAALAMDAWYATYSSVLSEIPRTMPTARVELAEPLVDVLTEEELEQLTDLLGLEPQEEDPGAAAKTAGEVRGEEEEEEEEEDEGEEEPEPQAATPIPQDTTAPLLSGGSHYYVIVPEVFASGRRLDRPAAEVEAEVMLFFEDLFGRRGEEVTTRCLSKFSAYFEDNDY